jgi:DUF1707 SHOCT-like domain/Cell wall-active antibiotics response LiaF, C-terminal
MGLGSPSADGTLASDSERAAVIDRLSSACAEGRLSLGEFGERSAAALASRTRGDLEPLVVDLPSAATTPMPWALDRKAPEVRASERHFSVLGLVSRRGRWKVRPRTIVTSLIGGTEIDLSQALISEYDVTLKVRSIVGRVEVIVPKGVRVEVKASSPIGGRDINVDDIAPDWPVIRLTAYSFIGGVEVTSK